MRKQCKNGIVEILPLLAVQALTEHVAVPKHRERLHKIEGVQPSARRRGAIRALPKRCRGEQADPLPGFDGRCGSLKGSGAVADGEERDRCPVDLGPDRSALVLDPRGH